MRSIGRCGRNNNRPKSWRFIQSKELYPYNTAISNRHFGSLPNTVRRVVNLWGEIGASGRIVGDPELGAVSELYAVLNGRRLSALAPRLPSELLKFM